MKLYKAVTYFTDLQDDNHAYHAGDVFPREGLEVSDERIKELSTKKNRRKTVLIAKTEGDQEPPKDTEDDKEPGTAE